MNSQNPFVPQGSLLEQQSKRRSRIKVGVFCVLAIGIVGLTAMLIQGCKREQTEENQPSLGTNETAMNTNLPPAVEASNPPVQLTSPIMTSPPVAPPETGAAATEYVVVKGDSFSKIAKKLSVSVKAIKAMNPNVESTKLKVGQKLSVPVSSGGASAASDLTSTGSSAGGETYTVKSGDTLTKIAKTHGTTVKAIESENNLSTTKIKVGQKLKIPVKAEVAAPIPAPVAPAPVPPQGTPPAPAGR